MGLSKISDYIFFYQNNLYIHIREQIMQTVRVYYFKLYKAGFYLLLVLDYIQCIFLMKILD